jgi:DNA-binding response OmpR family regulator
VCRKILIVEDNVDSREMLSLLLRHEGYSVVEASDGKTGLALAIVEVPDLIITDLNMPGLSGAEMIAQLRAKEDFRELPILVISAFGEGFKSTAITAGADRALSKPLQFDVLLDHVSRLLERTGRNGKNV